MAVGLAGAMLSAVRPAKVVAVAWIVAAVGLSVAIGPSLGWRGWMWLGMHHACCAFGAGWELYVRRAK